MMKIDINHLEKLSKLRISEEQVKVFEGQFEGIVKMVDSLPPLDIDGSLLDPSNPMVCRKDEVQESFKRDDILKNAPQVKAGCVVVPKIME